MRSLIVGMAVAVVAATVHAVSYTCPADTSVGLRFEGDTYAVSQTSGTISNGGTIVITNATVDAWMADANRVAFANGNSGTVNIDAGGHMPPIKSGTLSDGGVTYEGVGTISLYDNDHTFNGGVHICKSGVFRPFGDNCFGNVPEGAMDNIFCSFETLVYASGGSPRYDIMSHNVLAQMVQTDG